LNIPLDECKNLRSEEAGNGRSGEARRAAPPRWQLALGQLAVWVSGGAEAEGEEEFQKAANEFYRSTMTAAVSDGLSEFAASLYDSLQQMGVKADLGTYKAAISACAKEGLWEKALLIFRAALQRQGVQLDADIFLGMMRICKDAGEVDEVLWLLSCMKNFRSTQKVAPHKVAMEACGAAGQWKRVLSLKQDVENMHIALDEEFYAYAVGAASTGASSAQLLALTEEMEWQGIRGDGATFRETIERVTELPDPIYDSLMKGELASLYEEKFGDAPRPQATRTDLLTALRVWKSV